MNQTTQIERTQRPSPRRLAAIACLDVVGYSRLMGISEESTLGAWSTLRNTVVLPGVATWGGRVVDRAGDGMVAEFDSALNALRWAQDLQSAPERYLGSEPPIKLRIALHLADVIDGVDGELRGNGVNAVTRLQSFAEAGGVIVSRAIANAVAGMTDAVFVDLGLLHLKTIEHPIHAFRLRGQFDDAAPQPAWRRPMALTAGVAMLAIPVLASLLVCRGTPRERAERLLEQGLAIACQQNPCPRAWLARRVLFEQAIAQDPTFAPPYAEATFTYTNMVAAHISVDPQEDLHIAERLATRAIALAPDQAASHKARGSVLRQYPEKLEDALGEYLHAIAIDPTQHLARANAGWMLVRLGRPKEGEPYLQAALAAAPNDLYAASWLDYLGIAELFLGHYEDAAGFFQRALDQQAKGAVGVTNALERPLNLAAALALSGHVARARQIVADLRLQYPSVSTHNLLWSDDMSTAPGFQAGLATLRHGAVLAGVFNAD